MKIEAFKGKKFKKAVAKVINDSAMATILNVK